VKALYVTLGVIAALVLQTTLSPVLGSVGIEIDLGLVVVVFVGLLMGPPAGLLTGSATGLAQDALAGGVVGVSGLSKTLVGFIAGVLGTMFVVARPVPRFVMFFTASLVDIGIFFGLLSVFGVRGALPAVAAVLVRAIAGGTVGAAAFQLMEAWPRIVERRRIAKSRVRAGRV
jgi:rod shape-determining protein MreD